MKKESDNVNAGSMKCRICGAGPTIRSHLIPEAFVKEIFFSPKADEKHMLVHNDKDFKAQSNTGRFERDLLCAECDGVLGTYEGRALSLLKKLRHIAVGTKSGTQSFIKEGAYPFRVEQADDFVRFACGILWKYASTPRDSPSAIDVDRYYDTLQSICFHRGAIPETVDVFLERDLLSVAAFDDPNGVFYYSTPSVDLLAGQRMAWFSVGGFIVYIKLDDGGISAFAPSKCWMRGRKKCHFNVDVRSLETNMGIFDSIETAREDLARLNKKLGLPSRTRAPYSNP
ncbi:hypothetical protein [Rhizobium leguminosarum]|uniref:hypothetical protein n=1 Tax=Rhizobium leguminosarum TaxID=384 RepID=UPI001C93B740|nr:hypothetical protein [Rhizobium leguminosarum]MBY5826369.1 hypothetical protein [Rhizobium leguminosarum]